MLQGLLYALQKCIALFAPFRTDGIVLMEFELGVHDTDGRDQKNSMGFHHFEAFTFGAEAVLDGVHARRDGILDAFRRGSVSRHL